LSKVQPLTRRECALYNMGAFEMLVSHTHDEMSKDIIFSLIIKFLRAYMPEYDKDDISKFIGLALDEKTRGTASKIFDMEMKEMMKKYGRDGRGGDRHGYK